VTNGAFRGGPRTRRIAAEQRRIAFLDTERENAPVFEDLIPLLANKRSFNSYHGIIGRSKKDYHPSANFPGVPRGTEYIVWIDGVPAAWWSKDWGWSVGQSHDADAPMVSLLHRALVVLAPQGGITSVPTLDGP
jgi:hypothetical protein